MKKKNTIWIASLVEMMLVLVLINSCKKNDNSITTPTVATSAVIDITTTAANSGGNVSSDGGATVTARGVCWSITENPTTSNSKTMDGTGTGTFTSSLIGLSAATPYYVRAYATNNVGTAYGTQVSFTSATAGGVISGDSVTIGNQIWMLKNLDVTTYRNGDTMPQVTDATQWAGLTTGAWCYYDNDSTNNAVYGKLYNWYAVNDPRGLAPPGWHIPTDAEWTTLITFLGGDSLAGGKMKETGTSYWKSPNTGATNESGFTGLPGGNRYSYIELGLDGIFQTIGDDGYWWSSTQNSRANAWYRYLFYGSTNANGRYNAKNIGFSVRCVRD